MVKSYKPPEVIVHKGRRSIFCIFGLHKWMRAGGVISYMSNVREERYRCIRCAKEKIKYIPR